MGEIFRVIRAGWRDTEMAGGEIQRDESWVEGYSMDKCRAGESPIDLVI